MNVPCWDAVGDLAQLDPITLESEVRDWEGLKPLTYISPTVFTYV